MPCRSLIESPRRQRSGAGVAPPALRSAEPHRPGTTRRRSRTVDLRDGGGHSATVRVRDGASEPARPCRPADRRLQGMATGPINTAMPRQMATPIAVPASVHRAQPGTSSLIAAHEPAAMTAKAAIAHGNRRHKRVRRCRRPHPAPRFVGGPCHLAGKASARQHRGGSRTRSPCGTVVTRRPQPVGIGGTARWRAGSVPARHGRARAASRPR